jgi:hypothetical protein
MRLVLTGLFFRVRSCFEWGNGFRKGENELQGQTAAESENGACPYRKISRRKFYSDGLERRRSRLYVGSQVERFDKLVIGPSHDKDHCYVEDCRSQTVPEEVGVYARTVDSTVL